MAHGCIWAGKQLFSGSAHLKEFNTPHKLILWVRLHKYEDQKIIHSNSLNEFSRKINIDNILND
jgi:hypothetical protein